MLGLLSLVLGWGCGNSVHCTSPEATLAEAKGSEPLTCGEAETVVDYIELLAGRPVPHAETQRALGAVADRYEQDPAATRGWIAQIREAGASLGQRTGLDGAAVRAERVWRAQQGDDLIRKEDDVLWNVQSRALSVWAKDDGEKVAVTESDLEAWIRYASLCREAQGGGVLRISVADRVTVYRDLIARFDEGDRATQVALASMGPVWRQVQDRWAAASYEQQQAWIAAAPLPPPMTATSLGYAEAIFGSNLAQHAAVLHQVLGPFQVAEPGKFAPEEGDRP